MNFTSAKRKFAEKNSRKVIVLAETFIMISHTTIQDIFVQNWQIYDNCVIFSISISNQSLRISRYGIVDFDLHCMPIGFPGRPDLLWKSFNFAIVKFVFMSASNDKLKWYIAKISTGYSRVWIYLHLPITVVIGSK